MGCIKEFFYDISEKIYNYSMENDCYNILYYFGKSAINSGYDFKEFNADLIFFVFVNDMPAAVQILDCFLQDCKKENDFFAYSEFYNICAPVLHWR